MGADATASCRLPDRPFRNAEGPRCLALLVTRCTSSCVALRRIGRSGLAWRWTRDAGVRPGCECREPRPWRRIPTRAPYTSHAVILVSEMLTAGRTSDTRTYRDIQYQYIVSAERRQRQAFQQNLVHLLSKSPGKLPGLAFGQRSVSAPFGEAPVSYGSLVRYGLSTFRLSRRTEFSGGCLSNFRRSHMADLRSTLSKIEKYRIAHRTL